MCFTMLCIILEIYEYLYANAMVSASSIKYFRLVMLIAYFGPLNAKYCWTEISSAN